MRRVRDAGVGGRGARLPPMTVPPLAAACQLPARPPLARLLDHTADAVQAVRDGRSLTDVLARCPAELRPGVQALSFHTLRWLGSATEVRALLAPKTPPPHVDALLLTALALLWPGESLPYADHTLVDQAVSAARQRTPAAAGFVNAVLRRFLRERDALVAARRSTAPLGACNHPTVVGRAPASATGPTQWQALLASANQRPPMTLRVNARRGSGADYVQRPGRRRARGRASAGRHGAGGGSAQPWCSTAPCTGARSCPGFAEGEVSVQDAAAQRAAPLLLAGAPRCSAGARVLDACAAPGGKTAHLLELADLRPAGARQRPAAAGARAGQPEPPAAQAPSSKAGDARLPATLVGRPPVRRDPARRAVHRVGHRAPPPRRALAAPADDINALARIQAEMLDALWPLLAPGGRLLYATCSIFRAEGATQIDAFLQRQRAGHGRCWSRSRRATCCPAATMRPAAGVSGRSAGLQDGFFYALLHKTRLTSSRHRLPCTACRPSPSLAGRRSRPHGTDLAGQHRYAWQRAGAVSGLGGAVGVGARRSSSPALQHQHRRRRADAGLRRPRQPAARRSKTRCSAACRSTSSPRPRLLRNRWYWRDERVARVTRSWRVAYQPLTGTWRVGLGGLHQTHATLADALTAASRSAGWKLADLSQLDPDKSYYVDFSYRLDTTQLPGPMQFGMGGQRRHWAVGVR